MFTVSKFDYKYRTILNTTVARVSFRNRDRLFIYKNIEEFGKNIVEDVEEYFLTNSNFNENDYAFLVMMVLTIDMFIMYRVVVFGMFELLPLYFILRFCQLWFQKGIHPFPQGKTPEHLR